jgi:hypothetical protein
MAVAGWQLAIGSVAVAVSGSGWVAVWLWLWFLNGVNRSRIDRVVVVLV